MHLVIFELGAQAERHGEGTHLLSNGRPSLEMLRGMLAALSGGGIFPSPFPAFSRDVMGLCSWDGTWGEWAPLLAFRCHLLLFLKGNLNS